MWTGRLELGRLSVVPSLLHLCDLTSAPLDAFSSSVGHGLIHVGIGCTARVGVSIGSNRRIRVIARPSAWVDVVVGRCPLSFAVLSVVVGS